MRHLQRYIRKKFHSIREKICSFRKKSLCYKHNPDDDDDDQQQQYQSHAFQYLGYYECERLPPSSNRQLLVYDVFSIEQQTVDLMLEGFYRGFTPMDLNNDPHGLKICWIDLIWRGQIPLYPCDHGGFHIPKRLKQTLNSDRFTITVDTNFRVR